MSGLTGTFIKRYIADRTNKAEIEQEERSEKAESLVVGRLDAMKYG